MPIICESVAKAVQGSPDEWKPLMQAVGGHIAAYNV